MVADRPEFDFNAGGMEQPPSHDQFKSWKFKYDTSCTTLETKRGHYKVGHPSSATTLYRPAAQYHVLKLEPDSRAEMKGVYHT